MTASSAKPTMSAWVDTYLAHRAKLGKAKNTVDSEATILRRWGHWYDASRRSPRSVKPTDIEDFFIGPEPGVHVQGRSLSHYATRLNGFMKWIQKRDLVRPNPGLLNVIQDVRITETDMVRLEPAQLQQLIVGTEDDRDRAALALNIHGFARLSEVQNLRLGEINLDGWTIKWWVKKTKRYIEKPITSLLDDELRRWLRLYPTLIGGWDDDWLVIPRRQMTPAGWRWSPTLPATTLTKRFKVYTEPYIGHIKGQGGSHTLRRSAAYALIMAYDNEEKGWAAAQHMLGHRSRQQTEHYVGLKPAARAAATLLRGKDFLPDVGALRKVGDGSSEAV